MLSRTRSPHLLGPVFCGVAALLLLIGGVFYATNASFRAGAKRATGVVLRNESNDSRDKSGTPRRMYRPVISFSTQGGERVTFTDGLSTSWERYKTGEEVRVLYPARTPQSARIDGSFWENNFVSALLGGLAGAFGVLSIIFTLLFRHLRPR